MIKLACLFLFTIASPWTMASDTGDQVDVDSELGIAREMIEQTKFEQAVLILDGIVEQDSGNADAWNLHGYSHRKLGNLDIAANSYKLALRYDPEHKGALEYQGELFLKLEDLTGAKANLAKLVELCPDGCDELADLKAALASR